MQGSDYFNYVFRNFYAYTVVSYSNAVAVCKSLHGFNIYYFLYALALGKVVKAIS